MCLPDSGGTHIAARVYTPIQELTKAERAKTSRATTRKLCSQGFGAISLRIPPVKVASISNKKTYEMGTPKM
eukprot:6212750-Pleurochrysis_carterae.AAC.7